MNQKSKTAEKKLKISSNVDTKTLSNNQKMLEKYKNDTKIYRLWIDNKGVCWSYVPDKLLSQQTTHHQIKTEEEARVSFQKFYQLSRVKLVAAKKFIYGNLLFGKIHPRKFPHITPLFLAKHKDEILQRVVDYKNLNQNSKKNYTALQRLDKMFGRLG